VTGNISNLRLYGSIPFPHLLVLRERHFKSESFIVVVTRKLQEKQARSPKQMHTLSGIRLPPVDAELSTRLLPIRQLMSDSNVLTRIPAKKWRRILLDVMHILSSGVCLSSGSPSTLPTRIGIGQGGKGNSYVEFASLGSTSQRPRRTGPLSLKIAWKNLTFFSVREDPCCAGLWGTCSPHRHSGRSLKLPTPV